MDKMDRMLHSLPRHSPSPELAAHIQSAIHRRHRRVTGSALDSSRCLDTGRVVAGLACSCVAFVQ